MAAIAVAGVGLMVVCSSSLAAVMLMGGEEKEDPVVPSTTPAATTPAATTPAATTPAATTPAATTPAATTPAVADAAAVLAAKEAWIQSNCEPCHRMMRCPSNECYGCFGRNEKREHATYGKCPHSWDPCPDAPEGPCPK